MTGGQESLKRRMRAVLDSLPDPVVLLEAVRDDDGVIVDFTYIDANAAALTINRTTFDELIGDTVLHLFPEHGPSGLLDVYARVVETGQPVVLNDQPYAHEFTPGQIQYFDIRAAKVGDGITMTWRDRSERHADRQALEAERSRSRKTLDGLMDPVVYFRSRRDESGAIVDFEFAEVNDAACAYNHATRAELLGDLLSVRYADMWTLGMFDRFVAVAERGDVIAVDEWPYVSEHIGVTRVLDLRAHQVAGGLTVTWRDVTDQVERRSALEQGRAREHTSALLLRAALDSMLDPHVLLEAVRDADGHIVDFTFADANPAAATFNGMTVDQLVGVHLLGQHPAAAATGLFEAYVDVIETGVPIAWDGWSYPQDLLGGEVRRYDVRAVRVGDAVSQTWRDVTDRERAAQVMAAAEQRYRLLSENVSDVVLELDQDARITWASPSAFPALGQNVGDLLGRSVWDLIVGGERDDVRQDLRVRWVSGAVTRIEVHGPDGASAWMEVRAVLIRDEAGVTTGAVVGMSDVSDVVLADRAAALARQAVERTRLSMDEAAIGILLADLDGTVVYANPALHALVGLPDGGLEGLSFVAASPPDEQAAVRELVRQVAAGEADSAHQRRRIGGADGSMIWVDTFLSPLRDDTGAVDGLMAQIVDVTAEVANREALIRNAEHFRLLAENASDVVYETDRSGHIAWVSPSVLPALGWEPASLVGTLALDLVHPADREWVTRERAEVYRGTDKTGIVARFARSDGVIRYMSTSARVLRDGEGTVSGTVVGLHDVTTEVLMQNRIKRSEQMFRTAMVGAPQGMAISNAQDQLTDLNPALEEILGVGKVAILGLRLSDFVVPQDPPEPSCAERLIASGESRIVQHEHQLDRSDGPPAWIEHSVSAIRDDNGAAAFFVHHVANVTERRLREQDLGYRADHDVLTGLLNRDGLLASLSERMPVHGRTTLALLYCDLDNLKPINDEHGHAAGDAVLVEVARRIDAQLRRGDIVARIGGDEFVIVLDRIASDADGLAVAEKICREAQGSVSFDGRDLPATISMGVAIAEPTDTVESLLGRADQALYRAKTGGRARVST